MVTRETQNVRTGRGVSETWRQPDKISGVGWVIPPVLYDFLNVHPSDNLKQLKIMFLDPSDCLSSSNVAWPCDYTRAGVCVYDHLGTGRIKDSTAH